MLLILVFIVFSDIIPPKLQLSKLIDIYNVERTQSQFPTYIDRKYYWNLIEASYFVSFDDADIVYNDYRLDDYS